MLGHFFVVDSLHAAETVFVGAAEVRALVESRVVVGVLLEQEADGGVVMVLAALQKGHFNGFAWFSLIQLALHFVEVFEVRHLFVDAFYEVGLLDVVAGGEISGNGIEFGGTSGNDWGIAVAIIRDFLLDVILNWLERSIHAILALHPLREYVNLAWFYYVDSFFTGWLVQDVVGVHHYVHKIVRNWVLETLGPSAKKEDGGFDNWNHVLLYHVYISACLPYRIS
jgi:hypothetical protein